VRIVLKAESLKSEDIGRGWMQQYKIKGFSNDPAEQVALELRVVRDDGSSRGSKRGVSR
jgi:hypothetical protein